MSLFSSKTRKAANCAGESAAYATRSAGDDLRQTRDDARRAAYSLQKDLGCAVNQTERRARNMFQNVYGNIENTTDQISGQIRHNPLRALVILVSAGFAIGTLFGLAKRS